MGYLNHLTALEQAAVNHPNNTAFKIPVVDGLGWKDISYKVFWDDITRFGVHWQTKLKSKCADREVVGLWMIGKTYIDVVHLFSLLRAGYTPHVVCTYLEDIALVRDLFEQSGARIIICDVKYARGWEQLTGQFGIIPLHDPPVPDDIPVIPNALPALDGHADEILSIEQSSGSSSGRPKIVQYTRRWMDATAKKCLNGQQRTLVYMRHDSFCYAPQYLHSLRVFLHRGCIVLTDKIFWQNPDDLARVITECGVTDIALYPSLISDLIDKARDSPSLLEKMRSLQSLTYGGGPIDERAIELAEKLNIPLASRFGTTEVGMVMVSKPRSPHLLRFCCTLDYEFAPLPGNTHSNIQELVVLPTSPDCPHPSLRDPKDGKFYTKDLFERVEGSASEKNEVFIFRGRRDDIIIMEEASNCDAKYLEDKIAYLCHDLISRHVVVGSGRPSPALLVEPVNDPENEVVVNGHEKTSLQSIIAFRLQPFFESSKLYPHEVIKSPYIFVLPKGSLPLSSMKGRVMRSKTEGMFKEMLDKAYTGDSVWNDERST